MKCDHMFDLPSEPEGAQEVARTLYTKHAPYRIQTYWTNLLPGTEMVDQVLAAGLVTREQIDRLEDGHDFDFFRESNLGRDPRRMRIYKSYETLFKVIPVLSRRWRERLSSDSFSRIPAPLCTLISMLVDGVYGLFSRNPHHVSYARHYLHHLRRSTLRRLGIRTAPRHARCRMPPRRSRSWRRAVASAPSPSAARPSPPQRVRSSFGVPLRAGAKRCTKGSSGRPKKYG